MGYFLKYRTKYWQPFSLAILFLTLEAFCDLLQPTILSKIIDVGVAKKDMDYVLKMGGLMLLVTVLGAISASIRNLISSRVSQNFGTELRSDLFRKIQGLSFESTSKFDPASLVTRLTNDVSQVQMFVNGLMRIFVKAPLLCIGGLIMATRLNPQLAVVLAVVVPVVSILIMVNMRFGFPFFLRVQKALDGVNRTMREYLSGVRVVKSFNRFAYEEEKFAIANADYQKKATAANRVMAVFSPAIMLTINLGIVAVLWIGSQRVSHGQMQVGHIIAFINYMTQILYALMLISMVFNMFVRAKASAGRIVEVFAEENPMTWCEQEPQSESLHHKEFKGRIDFENVTFAYQSTMGEPVLKNITFTCQPGEILGIIGSTGSGKSSLVNLIPRFYDVSSGTIRLDGEDIRQINPKAIREKIAIVPQKTTLFTGSVAENIRWGKDDASMEELERAATIAQVHQFIANTPEGYLTRIGQGGVNLSGGQKQRISIARALVRQPSILILDDSTSAIDVTTEGKLKATLREYARGLTCILIAQRISSIKDADKILVLDGGEIVGKGRHEELLESCQVYREIYQSQLGKEAV